MTKMSQLQRHLKRDFDFDLPSSLIAQYPALLRDHSRLLHLNAADEISDMFFYDLPSVLKKGDLLVLNDVKVMPSRLKCIIYRMGDNGCRNSVSCNLNLTKRIDGRTWQVVGRPGRKILVGDVLHFVTQCMDNAVDAARCSRVLCETDRTNPMLTAKVIEKNGMFIVVEFNMKDDVLMRKICELGDVPLPPYLGREVEAIDSIAYQTVYAKKIGAVAAPTAGLHFTKELMQKLAAADVHFAWLTLYVGGGTFLPIKSDDIMQHVMHSESFKVGLDVVRQIASAKREGRRVICVGTTTLRVLESISDVICIHDSCSSVSVNSYATCENCDSRVEAAIPSDYVGNGDAVQLKCSQYVKHIKSGVCFGETDIFITPGYKFKIADGLITNFHLPKSTLFVLVCAVLGKDRAHEVYQHAIEAQYRFFSYGDACFFELTENVKI